MICQFSSTLKKHFRVVLVTHIVVATLTACATPTPSPTPFPTTIPTPTAMPQPSATPEPTATPTPTETPTPVPTPTPTPPPPASHLLDIAWDDSSIYQEGLIGSEQEVLERLPDMTVYHMDLQVPDDFLLLQGHEEVRYVNQEDESLDAVYFRLFANLAGGAATVSEVKVDGEDVEPVHESQNSAVRVPLPATLPPGEQVVIQMDFEVELPHDMEINAGMFGYFDGTLLLHNVYPVIPAYDDDGWYAEVPPRFADVTYLDASFYVVRVTLPANLVAVASGVEVSREDEADARVLTFAAGPARDFFLAAGEDYIVVSEKVGDTTVNSYTFSERADRAEVALEFATGAVKSYSERFGICPYAEFDVLNSPMWVLGMEYPGVATIGDCLYDPNETVGGSPSLEMLEVTVAHEVGHQWFYNAVGNDQVNEPWLDEAVVQYLVELYYADVYGEDAVQRWRNWMSLRWDRVDRADIPIGMPVGAYTGREYSAIVYGRGPLFMVALAEEMGQETFDGFLRDYYESHKWSIGTTETFKQLAEHHCQCNLTALFEEWVYEK